MRTLITVSFILFAAAVFAQPWGQFEIMSTTDAAQNLHAPKIAMIDTNTARVFYALDSTGRSEIRTFLFDLAIQQIIGNQSTAHSGNVAMNPVEAAVEGLDAWLVVYTKRLNQYWVQTDYAVGYRTNRSTGFVGITGSPAVPWMPSYTLSSVDLAARIGGGWMLTAVQIETGGQISEANCQIYQLGLCRDSLQYLQPLIPQDYQLFGPYYAASISLTQDTSLVVTESLWSGEWLPYQSLLLRAAAGADSQILDTICGFSCNIDAKDLVRASDGSLLAYSTPNYLYRISENGSCEEVGSLPSTYDPTDLDFRSGFGFAAIWINSNWIQLGRMRENGTMIQPGTFFWWDGVHVVRDASVAIAPDGRIYVAWTESSATETRLMIAYVNWDTPLISSDPPFILPPSSFILSAFPNPFNARTEIRFTLPQDVRVELKLFDVLGRCAAVIADQVFPAGEHRIVFNGSHLGSGIYFAHLSAAGRQITTKLVLLR